LSLCVTIINDYKLYWFTLNQMLFIGDEDVFIFSSLLCELDIQLLLFFFLILKNSDFGYMAIFYHTYELIWLLFFLVDYYFYFIYFFNDVDAHNIFVLCDVYSRKINKLWVKNQCDYIYYMWMISWFCF
jgi:hypothetical protein